VGDPGGGELRVQRAERALVLRGEDDLGERAPGRVAVRGDPAASDGGVRRLGGEDAVNEGEELSVDDGVLDDRIHPWALEGGRVDPLALLAENNMVHVWVSILHGALRVIFCLAAGQSIYIPMLEADFFKMRLTMKPSFFFSWMSRSWRPCLGG